MKPLNRSGAMTLRLLYHPRKLPDVVRRESQCRCNSGMDTRLAIAASSLHPDLCSVNHSFCVAYPQETGDSLFFQWGGELGLTPVHCPPTRTSVLAFSFRLSIFHLLFVSNPLPTPTHQHDAQCGSSTARFDSAFDPSIQHSTAIVLAGLNTCYASNARTSAALRKSHNMHYRSWQRLYLAHRRAQVLYFTGDDGPCSGRQSGRWNLLRASHECASLRAVQAHSQYNITSPTAFSNSAAMCAVAATHEIGDPIRHLGRQSIYTLIATGPRSRGRSYLAGGQWTMLLICSSAYRFRGGVHNCLRGNWLAYPQCASKSSVMATCSRGHPRHSRSLKMAYRSHGGVRKTSSSMQDAFRANDRKATHIQDYHCTSTLAAVLEARRLRWLVKAFRLVSGIGSYSSGPCRYLRNTSNFGYPEVCNSPPTNCKRLALVIEDSQDFSVEDMIRPAHRWPCKVLISIFLNFTFLLILIILHLILISRSHFQLPYI
ncbi:hypothetical protein EI94DRAFT_1303321 [Lactarius quietus]|nr:hypothetical protein EI94DRAFT_1303321 [Lactarius quietus]